MPKRRTIKRRKIRKSKKSRQNKNRSIKKGGSCGCQQRTMLGGNASNIDENNQYIIPLNKHIDDPSDSSNIMSVRMQPNMSSTTVTGGKKSKSKSKSLNRKTGGSSAYLASYNSNPQLSFNTTSGAQVSLDLLRGINSETLNSVNTLPKTVTFI